MSALWRGRETRKRLHVGCGAVILPGWINVDLERRRGVDRTVDVRRSFPFTGLTHIFAEHFLEHLIEEEGARFLNNCRRALRTGGGLRVSTPNLDWVMATHYSREEKDPEKRVEQCRITNRAFHGWGHRFLYNDTTLERALTAAGFAAVSFHAYGESGDPELTGLEKHERYSDDTVLPHVLIAEAR